MKIFWTCCMAAFCLELDASAQKLPDPFCAVPLADISNRQPESSKAMAAELQRLRNAVNPMESAFMNQGRLKVFKQQLAVTEAPFRKVSLLLDIAVVELNVGNSQRCLEIIDQILELRKNLQFPKDEKFEHQLTMLRATAWLRLGEQENCITNHTSASCLFPIRPEGYHLAQNGSRNAIREFTSILQRAPQDSGTLWLLNLAYMTLGEWPAKVPPQYLIPESTFKSEYDIGRFPDIASDLGLDPNELAGGVVADDFDNDGNLDLFVTNWGFDISPKYFHNMGDGTFHERGAAAGLTGLVGSLNMVQTDYDNDGFIDVLLLRGGWLGRSGHYPMSLLRNNRDGTFTDVTVKAGLMRLKPSQAASWLDFNNDGDIDLFVGNESSRNDPNPCELFLNNGDGTFTDIALPSGIVITAFTKSVTAGDFNNDGWTDLYLSNQGQPNILLRNDGPPNAEPGPVKKWKFTDVSREAGVQEPIASFPTWFYDYDNDGLLDIFVMGYKMTTVNEIAADYLQKENNAEKPRVYRNLGNGKFDEVTRQVNLHKVIHGMGNNFGDLDNDGWLDFYAGTGDPSLTTLVPNRMFRNDGGKRFQEVTTSGGFGHLQKGHAITFADLDNDGDQDVYAVMGGAYEGDLYRRAFFANPSHGNNWTKIKLEGVKSNRSAIGAKLKLTFTENGVKRTIHKDVNSGGSFGANPLRQELGVGSATMIDELEVYWPASKKRHSFTNLPVNNLWYLKEDSTELVEVKLKKIIWQKGIHKLHTSNAAARGLTEAN